MTWSGGTRTRGLAAPLRGETKRSKLAAWLPGIRREILGGDAAKQLDDVLKGVALAIRCKSVRDAPKDIELQVVRLLKMVSITGGWRNTQVCLLADFFLSASHMNADQLPSSPSAVGPITVQATAVWSAYNSLEEAPDLDWLAGYLFGTQVQYLPSDALCYMGALRREFGCISDAD